jgi:hypothetical protein
MARLTIWHNPDEWRLADAKPAETARRGGAATREADESFPSMFLSDRVTIAEVIDAQSQPQRRAAGIPLLDFSVPAGPHERFTVAIRHPSGALTFHAGEPSFVARRRGEAAHPISYRFRIELRIPPESTARRGLVSKPVKVIILKVTGKIADMLLPRLARLWEERAWKKASLSEGWFRVMQAGSSLQLTPAVPKRSKGNSFGRGLLFLHGTFSNAVGAFKGLAATGFFERIAPLYGDHIYAFNHFSVSKTPEENAKDLLAALPGDQFVFDAITHSRGGLVLRNLVERSSALGPMSKRLEVHQAILVASPNEGTPLATPSRWKDTVGWIANLLEVFPGNPFTLAAEWVAEAIVWIAERAAGGLPGLASMDSPGDMIGELEHAGKVQGGVYSALAANFRPDDNLVLRMFDVGVDAFFGGANDLVVPTEGGWRLHVDPAEPPAVPADRIGCFGPGGNFTAVTQGVNHLNFFSHSEAANFLVQALKGEPHGLDPIDPSATLPSLLARRAIAAPAPGRIEGRAAAIRPITAREPLMLPPPPASRLSVTYSDTFQLTIIVDARSARENESTQLLASYGGARVVQPFHTKGGDSGQAWYDIIRMNERIKHHVKGDPGYRPPTDAELIGFGCKLFDVMFPPEVRRLYDVARSRERAGHLNVIFTSMIPWVSDKPWEFAFDPDRKTFLATEEIHFVRNAITSIPAEQITEKSGPLRILVAAAQPVGAGKLSVAEEEAVIRRGFEPLIEARLVDVEILRSTTPTSLHRWISVGDYDVVHFIGHGEFDEAAQEGYLLFEDVQGRVDKVNTRNARGILAQRGIRLVFLNACETGRGGHADFNRGVAPALVAGGLPAVVANQYNVLDLSATEFAQHFYWALAQGATLGSATREARIAVNYSITGENIDWAVPVVYARDPESRICELRAPTRDMITAPLISSSARRSTARHQSRVAVWDMNYIFPHLQSTLSRMNLVQSRFGFEVVDISAPIGTWQRRKGGTLQLQANVTAQRLRTRLQELGVEFLICITDRMITYTDEDGTEHWNYAVWWPDPAGQENIIIFSAAFEDLPTSGREADRAIANAAVLGLTGILAEMGTHARGPKTCPLYRNTERSLESTTGKQEFDQTCRKRLRRAIPADLPALEAVLRTFD